MHREAVRRVEVQQQRADEHEPQPPQEVRPRQERHEHVAEELAVDVDVVGRSAVVRDHAEVHLEVADHVHHDEPDPDEAGDRHDVLLADGGRVELDEERLALGARRLACSRAAHRPAGHDLCHDTNANAAPVRPRSR